MEGLSARVEIITVLNVQNVSSSWIVARAILCPYGGRILMKRLVIGLSLLAVALSSLVLIIPTFAAHPKSIFALEHQAGKSGAHTAAAAALTLSCGPNAVKGNLLITITEKVVNDADSGQAGNYWALDAFSRTIKVWNVGSDSYCAVVNYTGTFAAQAGQKSPGTTSTTGGILTGDEVGTFKGGYVAQITGPLDVTDPTNWPLVGKVNQGNPVDYQCVINPDGSLQNDPCSGAIDWTTKYFDTTSNFTFNENPWGWTYVGQDKSTAPDAGKADGVWHNFSTGNSGDILDVD